ncbi:MAG: hypothetical protein WAT39_24165 [Planctomycetota bacterium]
MTHRSIPHCSLATTWRPLLGAAALLCALSGDALLAQNDWLKSKAKAKLDWRRHAVEYVSNDSAIADNLKQNNDKYAHGYQFAQWTWNAGQEGIVGSFYSCGFAFAKKWNADFEYKHRDVKFPSGGKDSQRTCPPSGGECDCECRTLVNSSSIGSTNGTNTTIGTGSMLVVRDATSAGPAPVSASMRLQARALATGQVIAAGEITLTASPMAGIAPALTRTGVFQNAAVSVVPTPLGFVVDLSGLSYSIPFGPATHVIELSGQANGSDADDPACDSPIGLPFSSTDTLPAGSQSFFDLVVTSPSGITITGIDVNTGTTPVGTPGTLEVWKTNGGYGGKELNAAAWTQVGLGYLLGTMEDGPSAVCLGAGFHLPAGSHGLALRHVGVGLADASGNGTPQVAVTGEARLISGASQLVPFQSAPLADRLWNGNLHYNLGNVPGQACGQNALALPFGAGCYTRGDSWYESFPGLTSFDLANNGVTATPIGPAGWVVTPGAGAWQPPVGMPVPGNGAPGSPMVDDTISAALALPFVFPFPGGATTVVHAGVDGYLILGSTTTQLGDNSPSATELLGGLPRLFPLWGDWRSGVNAGSGVFFEVDWMAQTATITWLDLADRRGAIPLPGQTSVSMQCVLHATGAVEYRYAGIQPRTGGLGAVMVGWSKGTQAGVASTNLGSRDLSAGPFATDGPDQRALELQSSSLPVVGTTWNLTTSNVEPMSPMVITMFGSSSIWPGLDLGMLGAPGCSAFMNGNLGSIMAPVLGGSATVSVAIPNVPALLGFGLTAQSFAVTPHNPLGIAGSNGLRGVVGQ